MNQYLYGNANPATYMDPTGQYAEPGHYYTVFLAANRAGYSHKESLIIALYAQLPDEVGTFDAINQAISVPVVGGRERNYLTKMRGPLGFLLSLPGSKREFHMENVQRNMHVLSGASSEATTLHAARTLSRAPTLESAGLAAHALGDSFSHRQLGNESVLYPTGEGHLMDGTKPDMIVERPELYGEYVKTLVATLAKRRGEPLTSKEAEDFAKSMVSLTDEPLKDARLRIGQIKMDPLEIKRGFAMSNAEGRVAKAIRNRAEQVLQVEEGRDGAVLLKPEDAKVGYLGGTHGNEEKHLADFYRDSLPKDSQGNPIRISETLYGDHEDSVNLGEHARTYMKCSASTGTRVGPGRYGRC
jgi:hypothetical protein